MSDTTNRFTVRLSDKEMKELKNYMEKYNIGTKADAVRHAIMSDESSVDRKLDRIIQHMGIDDTNPDTDTGADTESDTTRSSQPRDTSTDSPDVEIVDASDTETEKTTTGTHETDSELVTADGDVDWNEVSPSRDLVADPDSIDFDGLKQTTSAQLAAITAAINHQTETGSLQSADEQQIKNQIGSMLGVGPQTQQKYLDLLINHGVVHPHIYLDPELQGDDWDQLLQSIYGGDYTTRKRKDALPSDGAEMLGGWWFNHLKGKGELYLSDDRYRTSVEDALDRFRERIVSKWGNKNRRESDEWRKWHFLFRVMCDLAAERTAMMDDPVDADLWFNETMELVRSAGDDVSVLTGE